MKVRLYSWRIVFNLVRVSGTNTNAGAIHVIAGDAGRAIRKAQTVLKSRLTNSEIKNHHYHDITLCARGEELEA